MLVVVVARDCQLAARPIGSEFRPLGLTGRPDEYGAWPPFWLLGSGKRPKSVAGAQSPETRGSGAHANTIPRPHSQTHGARARLFLLTSCTCEKAAKPPTRLPAKEPVQ